MYYCGESTYLKALASMVELLLPMNQRILVAASQILWTVYVSLAGNCSDFFLFLFDIGTSCISSVY